MLPAVAYTSPAVLAWELRHLYAGSWTCLGRVDELLPRRWAAKPVTQRAVRVGDVSALLVARRASPSAMFANTCRHRGHELLPEGEASERRSIICPYHAWTYDLDGSLHGGTRLPGPATASTRRTTGWSSCRCSVWHGWVFGHAVHPVGSPEVPSFEQHLGELAGSSRRTARASSRSPTGTPTRSPRTGR